jgi:hypothetical protein
MKFWGAGMVCQKIPISLPATVSSVPLMTRIEPGLLRFAGWFRIVVIRHAPVSLLFRATRSVSTRLEVNR